jgi:uncharacterized membrane protein
MAPKPHLVLAFFPDEASADAAATRMTDWAKSNRRVELDAMGVLVLDEDGKVKTHKLGPRQVRAGIGVGAALGVVAAVASGGVTLVEGVVAGSAGGGAMGALIHRGLGLDDADQARIARELKAGQAALGVLVPENQAPAIAARLEELGGEPEVHEVTEPLPATTTAPATG